ncbi:MAG: SET domain-containing protein, partial [Pseudomonadota bacterium]
MATNKGVIAGYGCVAVREIATGEILFSIPQCACLGAHTGQPDGDCQGRIARQVLRRDPEWLPLLNALTPASCPWLWPQDARKYLQGTELEDVVKMKLQRLSSECDHPDYARACALVLSHVNPWFNTSIVPFSCLLNYCRRPNVKFAQRGQRVIGWALRRISPGSELTQEYASSTAEFVYRYGFTPPSKVSLPDDAVSVTLSDFGFTHHCTASTVDALVKALCLEDNPWDGLNHLLTVELGANATGTAKLVIVALALPLSLSVDDHDSDAAAASLAAAMRRSANKVELLVIAHANGGEDRDPWPALLHYLS